MPFPIQVFFSEVVATRKDKKTEQIVANARWTRAPRQMLAKCTEAAGLREAFPEEIGGEPTAEEMDGQRAIHIPQPTALDAKVLTALDRIPEGMRDNIERAFTAVGLTVGQRIQKANEFLGGDEIDPEAGAQALLDWLSAAVSKPKEETHRRRGNSKEAPPAAPESQPDVSTGEDKGELFS